MSTQPHLQTNAAQQLARGISLFRTGNLDPAEAHFHAVLLSDPKQPEALYMLGLVHARRGNWEECIRLMDKTIAVRPKHEDAYYNRGVALKNAGRFEEALASYDKAIVLKRNYIMAYNNRGAVLDKLRRYDEALASYGKAVQHKLDFAEAHSGRGAMLEKLNRYSEALAAHDKAISLKPDYAEAHNNRGTALEKLRRYDEALASYDKAIALKPDYANAYWNKGLLKILRGDYEEGWTLYEWRWKKNDHHDHRNFMQPLWLGGEDIKGKTILLYGEQGLGDVIQFSRYVPMVEALGAKVIVETPASLAGLLRTLKGSPQIVAAETPLPEFDVHCPIMSLPLAFKTTAKTIPANIPYLSADAGKCQSWKAKLGERAKPRIGLAWSGSALHKNDHNRSLPFALLAPLLRGDAEFHSLHKEVTREDAAALAKAGDRIVSHAEDLTDFVETAALIAELDMVISVDTSVAHLAGALGKPVWILLPFAPDYRWMAEREDSPWYPTVRLFRQAMPGDWREVIARVAEELKGSNKH